MKIIQTCPKCGGDLDYFHYTIDPPIPAYRCRKCGWEWKGEPERVIRVPFQPPESEETE